MGSLEKENAELKQELEHQRLLKNFSLEYHRIGERYSLKLTTNKPLGDRLDDCTGDGSVLGEERRETGEAAAGKRSIFANDNRSQVEKLLKLLTVSLLDFS